MEVEDAEEGAVRKSPLVTNLSKFQSQETRAKLAAMMRSRRSLANSAWHNLPVFAPSLACFGAASSCADTYFR